MSDRGLPVPHRFAALIGFVIAAAAATWIVYGHTVDYGFSYDDYILVRPYSSDEVVRSFGGTWDTTGVMVPFYRPLTVAFNAVRYQLFGLDSRAHHFVSLALFSWCAVLAGWISHRITGRLVAGFLAIFMFAAHPAMPYSLAAWITNQMHLTETLTVLTALCGWHAVRARSLHWWWPLLLLAAVAFMIKEDGIMLLPMIIAAHTINRYLRERQLPHVRPAFLMASVVALAALLFIRTAALDGIGGYGRPSLEHAWRNYVGGLSGTLRLTPPDRPWQGVASAFATALPILALLLWRRTRPGSRTLLVLGFVMALLFNLPFVLVSKAEQMHLVASGAVLVVVGSATMVLDALANRAARGLALGGLLLGIGACAAVARDITRDFEPFGARILATDNIVADWPHVPAQIKEYLARKREPNASGRMSTNPIHELSHVVYGAHGMETAPDGTRYQWMSGPVADVLVFRPVRSVIIPLRHDRGAFREPTTATIEVGRRTADEIRFETSDWRQSSIALPRAGGPHRPVRIRISIDHAWVPARIIPHSTDSRTLGLQIGELTLR
jgi:hypothetical protein